jgi:hypothetical protein
LRWSGSRSYIGPHRGTTAACIDGALLTGRINHGEEEAGEEGEASPKARPDELLPLGARAVFSV